jgi:hypothetical protein
METYELEKGSPEHDPRLLQALDEFGLAERALALSVTVDTIAKLAQSRQALLNAILLFANDATLGA